MKTTMFYLVSTLFFSQKSFNLDVRLSGHTCTKVDSYVYLIGGYAPSDGLSEFVYYIDLISFRINVVKFNDLEPVGKRISLLRF